MQTPSPLALSSAPEKLSGGSFSEEANIRTKGESFFQRLLVAEEPGDDEAAAEKEILDQDERADAQEMGDAIKFMLPHEEKLLLQGLRETKDCIERQSERLSSPSSICIPSLLSFPAFSGTY